jgi:hypothetical protein
MKAPATSQEAHHKVKMHKMDSRSVSLLIFVAHGITQMADFIDENTQRSPANRAQ